MCGDKSTASGRNEYGSIHVSLLDLPTEIVGILETVRIILGNQCGVLKHPVSAGDVAEAWFGRGLGLDIASHCLSLIRAVRQSRRSNFRFSNPACPVCREYVSGHEEVLLRLLMGQLQGKLAAARACAIMICEGHDETDLIQAAGKLSAALNGVRIGASRAFGPVLH